jgi:hypothetical protein
MRRALELLMEGASRDQAADEAGVSRMTLYRHLKKLPAPK